MVFGIQVAGGSDSYGYISQVDHWLAGSVVIEQPLAREVPWPDADATLAPLGYRPGPRPGTIVPVYAPGLPMLMAGATLLLGACGLFIVVPLLGALVVWLTYRIGAQVWSPIAGAASAGLMATSPVFLFMLMNPMSDVPVSAFFLLAAALALSGSRYRAAGTAIAVSIAIWIRPNLVPLGAVYLAMIVATAPSDGRWRAAIEFCLAGLPFMAALGAVNAYLYGAPWNAGYGRVEQFYAWEHILTNLRQYPVSLVEAETPMVLLALLAIPAVRWSSGSRRRGLLFLAALAAAVCACYAFYTPYDAWWYLRFFLPAFPVLFTFVTIGFLAALRRFGGDRAAVVGVFLAAALFAVRVKDARALGVFDLGRGGIVYAAPAEFVRTRLPENAIVLTVQHSGSVRYYSGRTTIRWDLLPPEWWPKALAGLVELGYRPYLLVAGVDEEPLRRRFGLSGALEAPGTLVAQMSVPEPVRIYDPLRATAGPPELIPQVTPCPCGVNCR
jgi:hypothetical protein